MNGSFDDSDVGAVGQEASGYYLVRLNNSIRFRASDGNWRNAEIQGGELRFFLEDWGSAIRDVSFQLAAFGPDDTGVISFRSRRSVEDGFSTTDISDFDGIESSVFGIDCSATYLDERMVAESDLIEYESSENYASPRDFVHGSFTGVLQRTDIADGAGPSLRLISAELRFEGSGKWEEIAVDFPEETYAEKISFSCNGDGIPVYRKTVKLQVVEFKPVADDSEATVALAKEMVEQAAKLWNPGFIYFDVIITEPVIDARLHDIDPRELVNLTKLWEVRPIQNELDRIPVFFVNFDLGEWFGGYTYGFSINTMEPFASVVISELSDSNLVLAHELGHVMGGWHPNSAETGYWTGSESTIMEHFPFEAVNDHENCVKAGCPAPGCLDYFAPECLEPGSWSL